MSKLPIKQYAQAFFDSAKEQNVLDAVIKDFQTIQEGEIAENFVDQCHGFTRNCLLFLTSKDRFDLLHDIVELFVDFYHESKNKQKVVVETPFPLDDSMKSQIKTKWEHRLKQSVLLEEKQNPDLLGGIVFRVDDQVFDHSVRTQLENLRKRLIKG